jgi:NAD(P)-dependent dehydrogenase (short-subunit alcohol dehydrogenase family)
MTQADKTRVHTTSARPLAIITGASRGVGLALARQWLSEGGYLLTIQRRPAHDANLLLAPSGHRTPGIDKASGPAGARDAPPQNLGDSSDSGLTQWACDLADPRPVAARLESWLCALDPAQVASLTLINNAALLTPPGPLADADNDAIGDAVRVGLEAPLLLSAAVLRATATWTVPRRLLHISSGLGRRAMAGSTVYCAVKAGLDHFSRALALEEAAKPHGARTCSLAPGVIDTDMQVQLRGADPAVFGAQTQFQALKDQGQLATPEACAAKLMAWLARPDFGQSAVADIREA